jgi:endonuclease/exonuclease/phosphatase (EEP) superfamily protein YafD
VVPKHQRVIAFLLRRVRFVGWLVIALGIVLNFSVRDRYPFFDGLFYALPLPVLTFVAGMLWLLAGKTCRSKKVAGIVTLLFLVAWMTRSWNWNSPKEASPNSGPVISILYWNLSHPNQPHAELIEIVHRLQPDFVGVGESGPGYFRHKADYESALPGYQCQIIPGGLILLTRRTAALKNRGDLDNHGAFVHFELTAGSEPFPLVLADIHSDPFKSRRGSIEKILAQSEADPRCIIMGDFNTPFESVWFNPYREQFQHAFTTGGRGLRETWFFRLPILCIDHIWVGRGWKVLDCQKIQHPSSDHDGLFVRLQAAT